MSNCQLRRLGLLGPGALDEEERITRCKLKRKGEEQNTMGDGSEAVGDEITESRLKELPALEEKPETVKGISPNIH